MADYHVAVVFTGHMVDSADRIEPRFPATMEPRGRAAIARVIEDVKARNGSSLIGIASGARGGDILFLEILKEQNLPFRMVLPFRPPEFVESSICGVPGNWDERFWRLWNGLAVEEQNVLGLPVSDEAYATCNASMLDLAESLGRHVWLLALWDGKDQDPKPGGTAHFIEAVKAIGGQVAVIDTNDLALEAQ